MKCDRCLEEAVEKVTLASSSGQTLLVDNLCRLHVQQEKDLATLGLSMVTATFTPLEVSS